jgi:hypothetical protein
VAVTEFGLVASVIGNDGHHHSIKLGHAFSVVAVDDLFVHRMQFRFDLSEFSRGLP